MTALFFSSTQGEVGLLQTYYFEIKRTLNLGAFDTLSVRRCINAPGELDLIK